MWWVRCADANGLDGPNRCARTASMMASGVRPCAIACRMSLSTSLDMFSLVELVYRASGPVRRTSFGRVPGTLIP